MEARLGPVLDVLDDGADAPLVIVALARAPFMTHGTLGSCVRVGPSRVRYATLLIFSIN